jgi:hypothetical protein
MVKFVAMGHLPLLKQLESFAATDTTIVHDHAAVQIGNFPAGRKLLMFTLEQLKRTEENQAGTSETHLRNAAHGHFVFPVLEFI